MMTAGARKDSGMKTIGLLGGMSWESTIPYYRTINRVVSGSLGGLHSAKIVLCSVDFEEIEKLQRGNEWDEAGRVLAGHARKLEGAGADFLVLCTNTMHRVAPQIEEAISIPLLHIADATAHAILANGIGSVGLLGTRFTMEQDFYRGRLETDHGLRVITPDAQDREIVHRVIYEELCLGMVDDGSRREFVRIIDDLVRRGAEGVILGCTEIGLLVTPGFTSVKLFDTTEIHARAAAELALS